MSSSKALPLLLLIAACGGDPGDATGEDDLTAADSAVVAAVGAARTRAYVHLSDAAPKQVGDALVASAKTSIDLSIYQLQDRAVVGALVDATKRHVTVRVMLVDGAKKRIYLYNQSLDEDTLVAKLTAAKKRGVDVQILLGYQPGFGGPPPNQGTIDTLAAAGCKASLLRKHYLHAKAIVADDQVYIGSQNFTNGGLKKNRELGFVLDDAKAVELVARTFASDSQ